MKRGIVMGILLGALTAGAFASGCVASEGAVSENAASESEGIFSWKVGKYDVFMLVESERDGNAGILVGVDEELLANYIPETGFKHTANAFLIKAGRKNILIDTGTGINGIILEKLSKLGVQPNKINAVLITHLHGDHFGSLQKDAQANFPNAKVYLSAIEHEYFTETNVNEGAVAALAPYGKNVKTFTPGVLGAKNKALLSGITAVAAYGHTPGHTVFLVENGKDALLIAGDFLHVALVQFPLPDISATYDMDKEAAAAVRRQILDFAAKNKIPVGGMHIVYPGLGTVEAAGDGYRFVPAN